MGSSGVGGGGGYPGEGVRWKGAEGLKKWRVGGGGSCYKNFMVWALKTS